MLERILLLLTGGVMMAGAVLRAVAGGLFGFLWLWLKRALGVVLALVVLFEEWGWQPLAEALAKLRQLRLVARLEGVIQALPPYAALLVFVLPSALLFPVKLFGLYLLAQGQKLAAIALIGAAKIVGTAIVARLFILTSPQLMRIGWFARLYTWIMPWKEVIFARIRSSWAWRYGRLLKAKVKQLARRAKERWWTRWRPVAVQMLAAARERLRALRLWRRG